MPKYKIIADRTMAISTDQQQFETGVHALLVQSLELTRVLFDGRQTSLEPSLLGE